LINFSFVVQFCHSFYLRLTHSRCLFFAPPWMSSKLPQLKDFARYCCTEEPWVWTSKFLSTFFVPSSIFQNPIQPLCTSTVPGFQLPMSMWYRTQPII
jgi:hypothetical protein